MKRGIYLMADTPTKAHPLAVEGGDGDRKLLKECLEEEGYELIHKTDRTRYCLYRCASSLFRTLRKILSCGD